MGIFAVLLAAVIVTMIVLYNRMVGMRRLVENAWADVDVYLKRRADLVPNLVSVVRSGAQHEKRALEGLVEARRRAISVDGPTGEKATAESGLAVEVNQTLMLAESYPQLRSSDAFLRLQHDLSENERLIADARQYYNACVRDYNTMIESFPQNVIAPQAGFRAKSFFEIEEPTERHVPGVSGL